jgi:hypothetical protein
LRSLVSEAEEAVRVLRDRICGVAREVCQREYGHGLRALVLTGSLARGEASFVEREGGWVLLGDAEFLLVFHEGASTPTDVRGIQREVAHRLGRDVVAADVTLSAVRPAYLRHLPPSIFAYELRTCGVVVDGDGQILSLVPEFAPTVIPLEDAWRLLANRIVEQLEGAKELASDMVTLSDTVHYRAVKLYLDMATSFLVFVQAYAPTYAERAQSLRRLEKTPGIEWPLPASDFADRVDACTRWKLGPTRAAAPEPRKFWEQAVEWAHALWRWELVHLVGPDPGAPTQVLMQRWMRQYPLAARLRSWAYVLRRQGWHRSWRHWPRWARLARLGSPRYCVYEAASELVFALGKMRGSEASWVRGYLPVVAGAAQPAAPQPALAHLAAEIVANYREFLVETRA